MPFNLFKMFNRKHKFVQNSRYLSFFTVKAQMNVFFFLFSFFNSISFAGRVVYTLLAWLLLFFFSTVTSWPIKFPSLGYFCCCCCLKSVIMNPKDKWSVLLLGKSLDGFETDSWVWLKRDRLYQGCIDFKMFTVV